MERVQDLLHALWIIIISFCFSSGASPSCHSGYEATVVPPIITILFCNPFNPDSRLTLPCEVTGPTAVQLDWYFNSSVKLINGSGYLLQESVVQENDLFISSLNISLIGLNKSMDTGQYSCKVKSKENNFELIPQLNFNLPDQIAFPNPCDEDSIKNSDGGPCLQVIPIVLPSTTSSTSSSIYSIFFDNPSSMLSSFFMTSSALYASSISSTPTFPPFTNSSGTIYTNTPSTNTDERNTITSNTITSASTLTYITFPRTRITNTPSPVRSTLSDIISSTLSSESNTNMPSNSMTSNGLQMAWLYLIFVIVILLFGVIVLSLVMIILCMLKSNRRVTMNVTPTLEEIGIHRTRFRKPSDPLPKISESFVKKTVLSTSKFNQQTLNSLQDITFNLGPTATLATHHGNEDASTLYDEIGPLSYPTEFQSSSQFRDNVYYNYPATQLTVELSSNAYTLPDDAHSMRELSCCIESSSPQTNLLARGDTMATTHSSSSWFGRQSPLFIMQAVSNGNESILGSEDRFSFALEQNNPSLLSASIILQEETPIDNFSGNESEDSYSESDSCHGNLLVVQNFQEREQANSLSKQKIELSGFENGMTIFGSDRSSVDSHDCSADNQRLVPEPHLGRNSYLFDSSHVPSDSLPTSIQLSLHTSTHLTTDPSTNNNSRASSSSSGCTDMSKYSGDYARDPDYMRALRNQIGLNPTFSEVNRLPDEGEKIVRDVRLDSGMECLYATPVGLGEEHLTPPSSINDYKSLDNLTIDPQPIYMQRNT